MSRLNLRGRIPATYNRQAMDALLGPIEAQVNGLAEGRIVAVTNADTGAPTTGTHAQGDRVWNSTPTEAGSGGSKYVILGWICVTGGTPGTWLQMRALTGN